MALRSAPSSGGWFGLGLLAVGLIVEAALAMLTARNWPGPAAALLTLVAFALLIPLLMLAYWVWGYFSLRYQLSRDSVTIRWAASRQIIPMPDITHVLSGREYAAPLRGLRWPGYEVGRTRIANALDDGAEHEVLVYATVPPARQLVILTRDLAYAISPADRTAFVREFKVRRRMGTLQRLDQQTDQARLARLSVWRDPLVLRLAAVGLVLSALTFAWLIWHYPALPATVALQFQFDPAAAQPVPGPPQALILAWVLPLIALAGLGANTVLAVLVHGRARLGARLLVLGGVLLQVAVAVVLVKMV